MRHMTRRTVLRSACITTAIGVAGCAGGTVEDGGDQLSGDQYPDVDEWLTESSLGGADDTYDGTLTDRRERDVVTIDVGAEGNGGAFAYGPSAVVISTGTTVEWSWTGQGNPHNVEALPEEQLGRSDYEFSSGEAESGSGVKYERTMDEAGIALYHCEPHFQQGMKGGIVVE